MKCNQYAQEACETASKEAAHQHERMTYWRDLGYPVDRLQEAHAYWSKIALDWRMTLIEWRAQELKAGMIGAQQERT